MNSTVQGMASQQQTTITDPEGRPLINLGLIPASSPAEYGIQFVNPTSGAPIMLMGIDGAGNVGILYYNGSGQKQSQYDTEGLHFYDVNGDEVVRLDGAGLHVYNSSGVEEVAAGQISTSPPIYGLAVLPSGGSKMQMVGGSLTVEAPNLDSATSNGTWTDFPSPSSITCEIGPSGQVTISVSSYLGTAGNNEAGRVGVAIDGTTIGSWAELSVAASGGVSGIIGSTYTLAADKLTPGSHTFQLQYMTGPTAETFQGTTMTVQPL